MRSHTHHSRGLSKMLHGKRRRRLVRLRAIAGVVLSALAPWTLGAAALVSFTATAGETTRVLDLGFRRSVMIETQRVTLMPPLLSNLSVRTSEPHEALNLPRSAEWMVLLPHLRKVDLARTSAPTSTINTPLFFTEDRILLPERRLDPAVTLERATQTLLARLSRFEGRTLAPGMHGGGSGDVAAQGASPRGSSSPQSLALSRPEGTTPSVSRAVSLASVTPAPVEPEIIAAAAMRIPAFAHAHSGADGPRVGVAKLKIGAGYLDIIDPESMKREQKCLAEAIYFEARSESEPGQAAVAQVVLNRVKSGLYPTNVCGVVYQNRHKYKACQFTFACEGKSLAITEAAPWAQAQRVAREVMEGAAYNANVGTSTHYHANYVAPYWSRKLKRTDQIGRHIFYRLRPGQT